MTAHFRKSLIGVAALGLLSAPALADEQADEQTATELSEGEQELAELLEGRIAGAPQRCIRNHPSQTMRTIDDTAYVYGRGNTIYVQRTRSPEDIDDSDILVIRTHGSQLCRLDQITTVDRYSGFFSGVVFFEDFVPYTRVKDGESTDG